MKHKSYLGQMTTNAFYFFHRTQLFSRFSELILCHGMWITKQCYFSPIKLLFWIAHKRSILKILCKTPPKNQFRFHIEGLKCSQCVRIRNLVSELSLDNIWPYFAHKTTQNRWIRWTRWIRYSGLLWLFSAKIWVKYYPNSILRQNLESSHQAESFTPQYESVIEN